MPKQDTDTKKKLTTHSMPYFPDFELILSQVITMLFDKLPFWYNKFAVLITKALNLIILLKNEVDHNDNS